jgi:hypothetical protein
MKHNIVYRLKKIANFICIIWFIYNAVVVALGVVDAGRLSHL